MKRIKPSEGNKTFCMAPWTHTYLSPQMERRCVVASREPAESFKQYIDTRAKRLKNTNPSDNIRRTLEFRNHMKSVRLKLLAGEEIPECAVCDDKLLNDRVYRSHFNQLLQGQDEAYESQTKQEPRQCKLESFDYRFSTFATLVVGCVETC